MKPITRLGTAAIAAAALTGGVAAPTAFADNTNRTVFVQTDNLKGNQIVAYDRAAGGSLSQAGVYNTGGLGGQLEGSAVDHTASQGALALDQENGLLYAVNAGSDSVSVFGVFGDKLALHQAISSGGSFPVSIAVHGNLVYVLNGLGEGTLQGFTVSQGRLVPLPGSTRNLGLTPVTGPQQFTHSPGQVVFSPDGTQLIVTTKANGNDVDVYGVSQNGLLSESPVVNPLPGTVPFAVVFDAQGHLILAESAGALGDFQLRENGTLSQLDAVPSEQVATCWVAQARGRFYTSNPGSASLSEFSSSSAGNLLTLVGDTPTDAGTVDAAVTHDQHFLYVQTGAEGNVDEFQIGAGGVPSKIGAVTVPGAVGGEGIVAG